MGVGFGCVVSKVTIWGKGTRPGKWEHTVNGGTTVKWKMSATLNLRAHCVHIACKFSFLRAHCVHIVCKILKFRLAQNARKFLPFACTLRAHCVIFACTLRDLRDLREFCVTWTFACPLCAPMLLHFCPHNVHAKRTQCARKTKFACTLWHLRAHCVRFVCTNLCAHCVTIA